MLSFSVLKWWHTYSHFNPNRCSNWWHKSRKKNCHILLKNFFFFKLYFQDEGDLYANSLFNVLTLYHKCYLFQFLSCDIRMHVPTLTGVQNGCMNPKKKSSFAEKYLLFSQMKVTCMQVDNIIFWLFTINTFFLSS